MSKNNEKITISVGLIVNKLVQYGAHIIFIVSIAILAYMSFVDEFYIDPSAKNVTILALSGTVLNWLIWSTFYKNNYDKVLSDDVSNQKYSIHRRYYFARKGWTHDALQKQIIKYNKDYREAWTKDVEDITGRTRDEIIKGNYKHPHKKLIWALKHKKYPSTGITNSRSLLYILSVSSSNSMKLNLRKAESYFALKGGKKIVTLTVSTFFAGSIVYEFITDNFESALLKLLMNVMILLVSLFLGSWNGITGGKIKLDVAEQVCEKLEEWKNEQPSEVPYKDNMFANNDNSDIVENEKTEESKNGDNTYKIELI